MTDGYRIALEAGDRRYDYPTSDRGQLKLCQPPTIT